MTVEHVKVYEIGENQASPGLTKCVQRLIHAGVVVTGFQFLSRSSMTKDRTDLADRSDCQTGGFQSIEQGVFRRIDRIVLSSFCSAEVARFADEGPRNDSSYFVFAGQLLARDLAPAIELFK